VTEALQRARELLVVARRERETRYAPLRRRAAPVVSSSTATFQPSAPAITASRGKTIVLGRDGNGIAFSLDDRKQRGRSTGAALFAPSVRRLMKN